MTTRCMEMWEVIIVIRFYAVDNKFIIAVDNEFILTTYYDHRSIIVTEVLS